MIRALRELVKYWMMRSPRFYSFMHLSLLSPLVRKPIVKWRREGRPVPPPPAFKRRMIRSLARERGIKVLVETGTYLGDTVAALLPYFRKIYSVEVNPGFYEIASQRFADRTKVHLICGDSSVELGGIVEKLDQAAVFFLDGHLEFAATAVSEEASPVLKELECILRAKERGHVVLVDDARCFGVPFSGYPTVGKVKTLVAEVRPDSRVEVVNDIIQILPAGGEAS